MKPLSVLLSALVHNRSYLTHFLTQPNFYDFGDGAWLFMVSLERVVHYRVFDIILLFPELLKISKNIFLCF